MLFKNTICSAHKGKHFGNFWYILDPLFQLLVWIFIFQIVFKIQKENYPIFLFSAIICWSFISYVWKQGCAAITGMGNFIYEVSFPKMLLLLNIVAIAAYRMIFQILILIIMLYLAKVKVTLNILYLFPFLFILGLIGLGGGLLFSVFGLFIKDLPNLLNPLLRLWWFLSPALYSIDRIPLRYRNLFILNPMCGLFQTFRNLILYGKAPAWESFVITIVFSFFLFFTGMVIFYKTETDFTRVI